VVACAVEPAARGIRFDRLLSHTDSRVLAARWLSPRVQPGDGVYQAATRYARLQLEEMETEPQWRFDEARSRFVPDRREGRTRREGRQPIWVVLFDSPLGFYTDAPRQLSAYVRDRYELVWMIRTRRPDARVVMDPQDAFFVPLTGHGYLRPGPDIQVYRRR
jgi:hypothetical protein